MAGNAYVRDMTRWCPVCESRGRPVVQGELSIRDVEALRTGAAVRVRDRLPGITPSHMCAHCPTFFRSDDRFYLSARHDENVHGIAVWPHGRARVRIELAGRGMAFVFGDTTWALLRPDDVTEVTTDFFWGSGRREIISWSSRRGFSIRLAPDGEGRAAIRVDPPGPHFGLLVAKTWAQENALRNADFTLSTLAELGISPLAVGPADVPV